MGRYSLLFLGIVFVSAGYGFGGFEDSAAPVARLLFYIFTTVFIISYLIERQR